MHTARAGLQMTDRTLTCSSNLFQGVCICAHAGVASCDDKTRLESLDFHAEPIPIHSPKKKQKLNNTHNSKNIKIKMRIRIIQRIKKESIEIEVLK